MALPNARNQYLKTQIETASKEQLVVMLFDGIIRFTEQARKAIEGGEIEESHHALMRAQAIIMELICTVDKDKGGEVAANLMSLHAYAFNCLIVCNMKKDVAKIDEVQKIYRELRDGWVNAMDTLGISSNAGKPAASAPAGPASKAPAAASPGRVNAADAAVNPGLSKSLHAANSGDVIAAAKPAIPKMPGYGMGQSANLAATSAPVQGTPVQPQMGGYGMGTNALMSSLLNNKPASAPQTAAPQTAAPQTVASASAGAKQSALLNAYGGGTRSIA